MADVEFLADVDGLPVLPIAPYERGLLTVPNVTEQSQGDDGTVVDAEIFDPRWLLDIATAPLGYDEFKALRAWVRRVQSISYGRFIGFDPRRRRPRAYGNAVVPPSPIIVGGVPQSPPRLVMLSGLGTGYKLRADDMIGWVSGTGVRTMHEIIADVTASGAGTATVNVFPRVLLSASAGTAVTLDRPMALFQLDPTSLTLDVDALRVAFKAIQVNRVLAPL